MQQLIQGGAMNRQKYIGGSDAAAIMGLSKWSTPLDVYLKKTGQVQEEITKEKELFFKRRKRQEPVVAEILTDEFGFDITRLSTDDDQNRYVDPDFDFIAAEIDFEFRMNDAAREHLPAFAHFENGTLLNGEIKTVHPFAAGEWGEEGSEEIPVYYAAQVMHGLSVTRDRPGTLVAALFGVDSLVPFPVLRDDETIAGMRQKEVEFWTNHVLAGVPPEPHNMGDIKYLFAKAMGRPVELSDEMAILAHQVKNIREQIKSFELDKEAIEFKLALEICRSWGFTDPANVTDDAQLLHHGIPIGTWKSQAGAYLDQKRLKEHDPDLVRKFTVPNRFRVLRIK